MKKAIAVGILLLVVAGCWLKFADSGKEAVEVEKEIHAQSELGDPQELIAELESKLTGLENERIIFGIVLTFVSAIVLGIIFVTTALPFIAQKMSDSLYDSSEEVEADPFNEARVFVAQGEWELAIEAFRKLSVNDPMNPIPWLEIAKLQGKELEDDAAAIATLSEGLQGQDWGIDDAAFFMFRIADIYEGKLDQKEAAISILEQVVELFPQTRHSANAGTKLRNLQAS